MNQVELNPEFFNMNMNELYNPSEMSATNSESMMMKKQSAMNTTPTFDEMNGVDSPAVDLSGPCKVPEQESAFSSPSEHESSEVPSDLAPPTACHFGGSHDTKDQYIGFDVPAPEEEFLPVPPTPDVVFSGDQPRQLTKQQYTNFIVAQLEGMTTPLPDTSKDPVFANEPQVPMGEYIRRMFKLIKIPKEVCLAASVYLHRLLEKHPALKVTNANCHRLFLIATMIASKMWQDIPLTNKFWAQISGSFTLDQINKMETEFLALINFNIVITDEEFDDWEEQIALAA